MKVTPDVVRHEFVGTQANVVRNTNRNSIGIHGRVIDESKNTLSILDGGTKKIVMKANSVFHFTFQDKTVVEIEGKLLMGRPEDRLKKSIRRLW